MSGAKYFSKLDDGSGYWQIKVDKESSNFITFGTTHSALNDYLVVHTLPVKFSRKLFRL